MELPPFLSHTSSSIANSIVNNSTTTTKQLSGSVEQEPIFYRQQILGQPLIFTHSDCNLNQLSAGNGLSHCGNKSILQVSPNACKDQYILVNEMPTRTFTVVSTESLSNCFLPSASSPMLGQILLTESSNGIPCSQISLQENYQPIQSPPFQGSTRGGQAQQNYVLQQQSNQTVGQSLQQQQQANSPNISGDEDGNNGGGSLSHTARTPPETLEWLNNNYEPFEAGTIPRCTLHCLESGLEPVNAASFGKLIRSVFKGLRTRRLGTRGNSKYHYNGIRIKPTSKLNENISPEEYNRMNPSLNGNMNNSTGQTTRTSRRISNNFQQNNLRAENGVTNNYQLRPRAANK